MATIVTRAGKGSPLTNAEVDANFTNLNSELGQKLTGNQTISFSGDATGSGATSVALTLANSGVTAGTYGNATNIPQLAVDAKGRITSVSNVAVSIPSGSLTFTGDVTGSGSTGVSTALTLANSGVTAGTYTKLTVDAKGRVTSGAALVSADLPTYTGTITSSQVTAALGFTPVNRAPLLNDWNGKTNAQAAFISGSTNSHNGVTNTSGLYMPHPTGGFGVQVAGRLDNLYFRTEEDGVWAAWRTLVHSGNFTAQALTSFQVTTALGFTPYNATNPSGYITNTGNARVGVENNGTLVGTRRNINFIPGTGISLSIADDAGNEEVDITITSTVTGGVTTFNSRSGAVTLASGDVTGALGFTPLSLGGGTLTGQLATRTSTVNTGHGGSTGTLEIMGSTGGGAVFSLHRAGAYAVNIGLDTDNVFRIGGWSASANRMQMDMSGNLTMAGNVTAFSDERLKTNWTSLPTDFVERLSLIKHGIYTRIDSGERQAGASAQQMQALLPEAVATGADEDKTLSLAYGNAALASAIQLAIRVVAQDKRIAALEALVLGDN